MASSNGTKAPPVEGVVASINERGIRLDGGLEWLNFSQYADVPRPLRGQRVRVTVKDRWITDLQVLAPDPQMLLAASEGHGAPSSTRERTINAPGRKAAAAFAASRPDAKSSDVPKLADAWLRWVLADEPDSAS